MIYRWKAHEPTCRNVDGAVLQCCGTRVDVGQLHWLLSRCDMVQKTVALMHGHMCNSRMRCVLGPLISQPDLFLFHLHLEHVPAITLELQ